LRIEHPRARPRRSRYTAFNPGRGLLPDDFPEPYLKMWELDGIFGGASTRGSHSARAVPRRDGRPALAEPGEHSTIPPRKSGGNMDIKQLTAGTTL